MLFCNSSWLGSTTATRRQRSVDMSGVTCLSYRHCSFLRPARLLIAWMLQRDAHEFSSLFCFLLVAAGWIWGASAARTEWKRWRWLPTYFPPTQNITNEGKTRRRPPRVVLGVYVVQLSVTTAWFFSSGLSVLFPFWTIPSLCCQSKVSRREIQRESFFSNSLRMGFDSIVCSPLLLQPMFAPSCANRCCVDLSDDERR